MGQPVTTEQLHQHACIVDNNYPGVNRWTLGPANSPVTINVNSNIELNGARAARELVLPGHGIGFLPSFAITDDIKQGNLIGLLPEYASEPIGIYAAYPNRKHLSAKVRLFIDIAVEYCKEGAY